MHRATRCPPPAAPALTHGFEVAFYVLIGLALAGAAVAAVFIESKPKPDAAPTAMPLEAELGLQEAA